MTVETATESPALRVIDKMLAEFEVAAAEHDAANSIQGFLTREWAMRTLVTARERIAAAEEYDRVLSS